MKKRECIPYEYHNLPIPGGGYVTGFAFHHGKENILYARTDIGGTYRFDYEKQRWYSLIDHLDGAHLEETYPIAIALDERRPDRLFIMSGVNCREEGTFSISEDHGASFQTKHFPAFVHGNWNGRGTGMRLVVDPEDSNTLYFASQRSGLAVTHDMGDTWELMDICGEKYLTFVWISPKGSCMVVATAGVTTKVNDRERGHSLYVSYDKGVSFHPMDEPVQVVLKDSKMSGLVGERCDFDGKYLYITFANTGKNSYVIENGYSCDSGDVIGGRVARYRFTEDSRISICEDITPVASNTVEIANGYYELDDEVLHIKNEQGYDRTHPAYNFGFSGISACSAQPGLVIISTICRKNGDKIYLSTDYGENWQIILHDLGIGNIHFHAPYMKKEYNGGHSLIHWLSDLKINPLCPNEAWFNSGTGVFRTTNLLDKDRSFSDCCTGIEETVHLNVYSPTGGPVQCIDIVGDLGGFAFEDVDKPCENSFADAEGNRYITCINADFCDEHPETVIVTPRGNWTAKTKGGLILSTDQCRSFTRLEMPYGISEYIDGQLERIEHPNTNSGWVSMSADGMHIVWSIADYNDLLIAGVICSHDQGVSFEKVHVYDQNGTELTEGKLKTFSDRKDSSLFYGFDQQGRIYVSRDFGTSFYERRMSVDFPRVDFGIIDTANKTEIRGEGGKTGVFYVAAGAEGLWKLFYDREEDKLTAYRLTEKGDHVYRMGLGVSRIHGDYLRESKAVYFCGEIGGVYGFYRTFDDGKTLELLNHEQQMFGEINSIDGDSRTYGRFFIATGSRGLLYGEEQRS